MNLGKPVGTVPIFDYTRDVEPDQVLMPGVPLSIHRQSVRHAKERDHRADRSGHSPIGHKRPLVVYQKPAPPDSLNSHGEHQGHHVESLKDTLHGHHYHRQYDTRHGSHLQAESPPARVKTNFPLHSLRWFSTIP